MTTANLELPELAASQSQPHVTVNTSLRRLDALVQLRVVDKDLTTPHVGSPNHSDGEVYIVPAGATGAWAGHDFQLAFYSAGWEYFTPLSGWRAYVVDEDKFYEYTAGSPTGWTEVASGATGSTGGRAAYSQEGTAGPATLTAAQIAGSNDEGFVVLNRYSGGPTDESDTLPDAVDLKAHRPNLAIGESYVLRFMNDGTGGTWGLIEGTDVTFFDGYDYIFNNEYRDWVVTRTADEAYELSNAGGGPNDGIPSVTASSVPYYGNSQTTVEGGLDALFALVNALTSEGTSGALSELVNIFNAALMPYAGGIGSPTPGHVKGALDNLYAYAATIPTTVGLPLSIPGRPTAGAIYNLAIPFGLSLPAALTGSVGKAGTPATASAVFTLYKNGASFGTVTFATGSPGDVAVFAAASPSTFAAGDILGISAPAAQDTTLADVGFTLLATRT